MTDLKLLGIDTSGRVASVAITDGGEVLWEKSIFTKLTHSEIILPMVSEGLRETGLSLGDLTAAVVAKGPGSYTGLRIGVGAVKGLCMGLPELKCAGVSTLEALAYNCLGLSGQIAAVMRARPGIVYGAVFESRGGSLARLTEDSVGPEEELAERIDPARPGAIVGDFAAEFRERFFPESENIVTAPGPARLQRAASLCLAAEQRPELLCSAPELTVSYLQATRAEKLRQHRTTHG